MNETIVAYNKTSDAGPDTSSFSIFMDGCNLHCPYCMNGKLISKINRYDETIIEKLKADVDKYDPKMIFISGGEPTINPIGLNANIDLFKSWGLKVGLSTNGTNTNVLRELIDKIDYIAMDLKGDENVYSVIGTEDHFVHVLNSWLLLRSEKGLERGFDYEIRTTLYPDFINKNILAQLAVLFKSDEKWVWQQFRKVTSMPDIKAHSENPFTESEIKEMQLIFKDKNIKIRYI